jgi:hypothetical protein
MRKVEVRMQSPARCSVVAPGIAAHLCVERGRELGLAHQGGLLVLEARVLVEAASAALKELTDWTPSTGRHAQGRGEDAVTRSLLGCTRLALPGEWATTEQRAGDCILTSTLRMSTCRRGPAVMKPWIAKKVIELLGFEDDVLIEYIHSLLEDPENHDGHL